MTSSNPPTIDTQEIIVEAFRQHGVVIKADDPLLALGTVLEFSIRRSVEQATKQFELAHQEHVKRLTAKELETQQRLEKLLKDFRKDIEQGSSNASYRAEQAVKRALSIHPSEKWRDRCVGAMFGAILILLAVILSSTSPYWKSLTGIFAGR